ncbi:hypothetical protein BSO19_20985 [Escherichia coli]|nr:hypothetical protein BSO19_20985 [Escherichia coli]
MCSGSWFCPETLLFSTLIITLTDEIILSRHSLAIIAMGNDSNLLIVFYVQIMPDDFVMQLHRF